ncbi:uncharacterized protein K460DRAFT_409596 [Cucurbitaria berberidis CBS 394.84]|uniref:Uncharacterized protein n=1 Tax=Cucurbitaria berberidis CBS 394.84 TaxID=1168544 RepID=A0A9P4GAG2_9PLEO|nr:uncharacterized protein K460DRAFT_409596 [Cucurbitaria berberidis CBS 394.84]KAF1842178.1 hypothetical protein K460DRAFT_409596 [Cucurbitaria berberidis CBS 394.84]
MENHQVREAAGGSEHRQLRTSQSQPRQSEAHHEAYPYNSDDTDDDEHVDEFTQDINRRRSSTSASQQPGVQDRQRPQEPSRTSEQNEQASVKATSSEPWDIIEREVPSTTGAKSPTPSYDFPGTWDAALHETTSALSQVGVASKSYATALSHSGVGKAGWSIGSALASSANKGALSLATWAVDKVGADTAQLPSPLTTWLGKQDRLNEARGRAKQAEERRRARKRKGRGREPVLTGEDRTPLTFGDEQGAFVLETHELDSTGQFVDTRTIGMLQEDGWATTATSFNARTEAPASSVPAASLDKNGLRGREEEKEEEQRVDDGLVRMFDFDD